MLEAFAAHCHCLVSSLQIDDKGPLGFRKHDHFIFLRQVALELRAVRQDVAARISALELAVGAGGNTTIEMTPIETKTSDLVPF